MESRLLAGDPQLFSAMRTETGPDKIWPSQAFFEAKREEQWQRHHRYHDTAYNLEPNVKGSPGRTARYPDDRLGRTAALRRRNAAPAHQPPVSDRARVPEPAQRAAHFCGKSGSPCTSLPGRREDRLLFDHQVRLAEMFGYQDAAFTLAVEQLMQRYYRTVMKLSRLNEMLLQLFEEAILLDPNAPAVPITSEFESRNGYLAAVDDQVFLRNNSAMLGLFQILQSHLELKGVSAPTIRLLRKHRYLINEEFRQNPAHHRLFIEMMSAENGVTRALRRMNRYGVLGRYIPAFGRIVGRMQYDLFHAYTVDAHTLFVINNLRRFSLSRFDNEFPYCSQIMQSLPKPELAYLAGLFHDIAKGRGGDHSELGAVDAEAFCREHGLGSYDARLVAWLVRNHLILSITAQKKDISDPLVIQEFARKVGDQAHLDYLYVLTVADVRATNPNLWNSWKASLFEEFYRQVRTALVRGLENAVDREALIEETRQATLERLAETGIPADLTGKIWSHLHDEHFLRHRPDQIAWHTLMFAAHRKDDKDSPFAAVREKTDRGTTAVLTFMPGGGESFARATAVLDELGLNILDAEVSATRDGYSLDTFHVSDGEGEAVTDADRIEEIKDALQRRVIDGQAWQVRVARAPARQLRSFTTKTRISFSEDARNKRTIMELVSGDRPGLLSEIGQEFVKANVRLQAAKITTVGERAEDVFFISDQSRRPLAESACQKLERALCVRLDSSA